MIEELTDEQLEQRLDMAERLVLNNRDPKSQPALNITFQKLLDEQVRRDAEKESE